MEEWRDVVGYEALYQVSNIGRVRSLDKIVNHPNHGRIIQIVKVGRVLKARPNEYRNGYIEISLTKNSERKMVRVHRLVAFAFLPGIPGKDQINHINGITSDNRVDNLEWVTGSENMTHAFSVLGNQRTSQQKPILFTGGDGKTFILPHQHFAAKTLGISRGALSTALRLGHRCAGYKVEFAL